MLPDILRPTPRWLLVKSVVLSRADSSAASWSSASYKGKTYDVPSVEAFPARFGHRMHADALRKAGLNSDRPVTATLPQRLNETIRRDRDKEKMHAPSRQCCA